MGQGLAETDDKIESLALTVGFGSAAYFCTVFRQETGLTPAEFRHRARIREWGPGRKRGTAQR